MSQSVEDKVHSMFTGYPKRAYPKGQILIFADEEPDHVFYLTKGKVIKYDVAYNGEEVIVNVFKPQAFFPMSWVLNKGDNHFFYKTESPVELYVIPSNDTLRFLQDNPDVTLDLLERVYRGTEGLLTRMVQLMSGSAKSRLLLELMIEAKRFGAKDKNGRYELNLNEQELASRAGMSRETVSREMNKMKDSGLVKINQGKIIINDLTKIEALLHS